MVIGLIRDGDKSAYRRLNLWCGQNNLELNPLKAVKMTVGLNPNPLPPPLHCLPSPYSVTLVAALDIFRFLGTVVSQELTTCLTSC